MDFKEIGLYLSGSGKREMADFSEHRMKSEV
jgi:hypothetical protein